MPELDWSSIRPGLPFLWEGMQLSLLITAVAATAGIVWGSVLAVMRVSSIRVLSYFARAYVNLFRSLPLVLLLLWFFLVIPQLLSSILGLPPGTDVRIPSALIGFSLFQAAYYSEIIRAGIQSVSAGQLAAAQALGMTYVQAMRLVILPQALRHMRPVLLTQTIILFQDTTLVYVAALGDFFYNAHIIGERDSRMTELVLFAGAVYLVICATASYLVRKLTIERARS